MSHATPTTDQARIAAEARQRTVRAIDQASDLARFLAWVASASDLDSSVSSGHQLVFDHLGELLERASLSLPHAIDAAARAARHTD